MYTITFPRSDLTTEEVVTVLGQGLGTRHHVLAGIGISVHLVTDRVLGQPDTIFLGTGPRRLFRAEVAISRHAGTPSSKFIRADCPARFPAASSSSIVCGSPERLATYSKLGSSFGNESIVTR